jgi:hypothetical protein
MVKSCKAKTAKGTKCSRSATTDDGYCTQHAKASVPAYRKPLPDTAEGLIDYMKEEMKRQMPKGHCPHANQEGTICYMCLREMFG